MFSVGRLISNTPEERITRARNTQSVNVLNVLGGGLKFQDSKSLEDFDKKAESTLILEVQSDTGHPHKVALNFLKGLGKDMPVKIYQEGYMIESALENWATAKQAIINIKIKGFK